jgi:hypothetical protein
VLGAADKDKGVSQTGRQAGGTRGGVKGEAKVKKVTKEADAQ